MNEENENTSLDWNLKGHIAQEIGSLVSRYNRYSLQGRQGTFEAYKSLKQIRLVLSAYIQDDVRDKFLDMEINGDGLFNVNEEINDSLKGFQTRDSFLKTAEGKILFEKLKKFNKEFNLNNYAEKVMELLKILGFAFGAKEDSSQMKM